MPQQHAGAERRTNEAMNPILHHWKRAAAAAAFVAVIALGPAEARAFHSGGVADCDGCHTMHDRGDDGQPAGGSRYLLRGPDASSRCLYCHSSTAYAANSVLTTQLHWGSPPANFTPGGDFAWLKKSFTWTNGARYETSRGEHHGHNVVAADFQLIADATRMTAPGGTFPSDKLTCTSCHYPHGRYRIMDAGGTVATSGLPLAGSGSLAADGRPVFQPTDRAAVGSYRLLGGVGYVPKGTGPTVAPFFAKPPTALAPIVSNQGESLADVRVAYGAGMSEWCGNCHGGLHTPSSSSPSSLRHPSGDAAKLIAGRHDSIYNAYAKGGDLGGSWITAYTSLVPFEEGTTDRFELAARARNDGSARTGPRSGNENVMCLSCHRAHASGWDGAMRWNTKSEFIVAAGQWPGTDASGAAASPAVAQGRTQAETRGAMYDRSPTSFASFQTSLCNKCHAK
jgi:hypothetical protein